jgi:WD40 repeat protein
VLIWEVASGRQVYRLRGHPNCVYSVAISPDGKRLVSAGGKCRCAVAGKVKIWDMNTGMQVGSLGGFTRAVFGVAFSPCGTRVATCGESGMV